MDQQNDTSRRRPPVTLSTSTPSLPTAISPPNNLLGGSCRPVATHQETEHLPPLSNTGVVQHCDYLKFTTFASPSIVATAFVYAAFGLVSKNWKDHLTLELWKHKNFTQTYRLPGGGHLHCYPSDGLNFCTVELKGSEIPNYPDLHQAMRTYLHSMALMFPEGYRQGDHNSGIRTQVTRFDLAVDHCPFTPDHLRKLWELGKVKGKCRTGGKPQWQSNDKGDTLYVGSRKSDRFLRIYDKHGFTRVEAQLSSSLADAALACWILNDDQQLRSFISDYVEFGSKKWLSTFDPKTSAPKIGNAAPKAASDELTRTLRAAKRAMQQMMIYRALTPDNSLDSLLDGYLEELTPKNADKLTRLVAESERTGWKLRPRG